MKRLFYILLFAIFLVGCVGQSATYQTITSDEALKRFEEDGNYIILDVRRLDEYESGHIPNAINLPNETISQETTAQFEKDQEIYIYCRSGNRSAQAAKKFVQLGFTNIYDFGGILSWPGEIVEGGQ